MRLKQTLVSLALLSSLNFAWSNEIVIDRYEVAFPEQKSVAYQGKFATAFPEGLPIGIGSGLYFIGEENGELKFVTVTDRGPNADSPKVDGTETKIFIVPNYTPLMMDVTVGKNGAIATNARPLHDDNGNISGLPLPKGLVGSTHEIPLTETLDILESKTNGLDVEGIVADGNGGYWLSDEYGPFLIHIDAQGKILEQLGPTPNEAEKGIATGLPNIIKWRQPNRGFEGIARLPDGTIVAPVQSTLDIDGKTAKKAGFTRLVSYHPETKATKMIAYPIDVDAYESPKDAKIGDIVALDQDRILIVEQGKDKNGEMRNLVYVVNMKNASDLAQFDEKQAPEFNTMAELNQRGIQLAEKELLIDLREYGWRQEKAEGLALVNDHTIALINDNDFGVQTTLVNPVGKSKMKDYSLNGDKQLMLDGKVVDTTIAIEPLPAPDNISDFWVIKFPEKI